MKAYRWHIVAGYAARAMQFGGNILLVRGLGAAAFGSLQTVINGVVSSHAMTTGGLTYALLSGARRSEGGRARLRVLSLVRGANLVVATVPGLVMLGLASTGETESIGVIVGAGLVGYALGAVVQADLYFEQRFRWTAALGALGPLVTLAFGVLAICGLWGPWEVVALAYCWIAVIGIVPLMGRGGERAGVRLPRIRNYRRWLSVVKLWYQIAAPMALVGVVSNSLHASLLAGTMRVGGGDNGLMAVGLTIVNLLMVIPQAVGNLLLSHREAPSGEVWRRIVFATVGTAFALLLVGFDILLQVMGEPVDIDVVGRSLLVVGGTAFALARVTLVRRVRAGVDLVTLLGLGVTIPFLGLVAFVVDPPSVLAWFGIYSILGLGLLAVSRPVDTWNDGAVEG